MWLLWPMSPLALGWNVLPDHFLLIIFKRVSHAVRCLLRALWHLLFLLHLMRAGQAPSDVGSLVAGHMLAVVAFASLGGLGPPTVCAPYVTTPQPLRRCLLCLATRVR